MHRHVVSSAMSLLLLSTTSAAFAQTGVSDDRVSLPDGPGSLDGIGDNASVDANMGQMSTSVKIRVPGGYAGVTPELALAYSSGGGGGMLGTGWSMSLPFIERMTSKGLPDYDDDDRFVFGGSEQLVRIDEQSDTDVAVLDALSATPDDAIPETSEESAPELTDEMLADETVAEEEAMDLAALPEEELGDFKPGDETDLMARYAATGIWPEAPEALESPAIVGIDDVFVASIDRTDMAQDAVALPPDSGFATDNAPTILSSPAAHGTDFELDPRGLVAASAEGTLNPDGVMIYAGRPPLAPATIPARVDVPAETVEARNRLVTLRPRARPEDLQEQAERNQLGGLTRTELATLRPRLRPQSEQEQELQEQAEPGLPPTKQAVAASPRPGARPSDFASIVQQTVASVPSVAAQPDTSASQSDAGDDEPEPEQTAAAATVQPSIPTAASVARQATQDGAINLNKVNLIGVYGTSSDRRALVRLPSGRYKKVQVGDTVDGGRVVAIGDSELRYQKKGRNMTLKIPSG